MEILILFQLVFVPLGILAGIGIGYNWYGYRHYAKIFADGHAQGYQDCMKEISEEEKQSKQKN